MKYATGTELLFDLDGKRIHSRAGKPRWKDGKAPSIRKNIENSIVTTTVLSNSHKSVRVLSSILNEEECEKMFPADGESTFPGGFSLNQPQMAVLLGCGATDEQSGILSRSP